MSIPAKKLKPTWPPVVAPIAAAVFAWLWVSTAQWSSLATGLLPAFSVVAGAVLVRLSRGVPFTNADHFTPDEAEAVTEAVKKVVRSLRSLIVVVLGTMLSLVVVPRAVSALAREVLTRGAAGLLDAVTSAILGALCAYVFVRVLQVVWGDVSLVDLQATTLVKAVRRKSVKAFDDSLATGAAEPFKTPAGYGKPLQ